LAADMLLGYGERPINSLVFGLGIVFLFAVMFYTGGGLGSYQPDTGHIIPASIPDCISHSLASFATVSISRIEVLSPIAEFLTSLEALLGVATLAMVMYALGNRVGRS